jgi:hypothetical protein
MPMHLRPSLRATRPVVPEPRKGSAKDRLELGKGWARVLGSCVEIRWARHDAMHRLGRQVFQHVAHIPDVELEVAVINAGIPPSPEWRSTGRSLRP